MQGERSQSNVMDKYEKKYLKAIESEYNSGNDEGGLITIINRIFEDGYQDGVNSISENEVKEALSATGYRVSNNLIIPLKTVPLPVYLTLVGEVFLLFLLGLGIHLLASSWSRASLIHAINQADQSNRVSLKQSSLFGFKKFKTILAIDYLPWLPLLKFTIFAILISIIFAILGLAWLIMFPVIAFSIYLIIASTSKSSRLNFLLIVIPS